MIGDRYSDQQHSGPIAPTMTEKIWEHLFMCIVPSLQIRSVEDIRRNGIVSSGIREVDEGLRNAPEKRMMTINQMVEAFNRGVPIRICKFEDTATIYDIVQTHLTQWLEHIRTGLNAKDAPVDELMLMDRFANSIYQHARYIFTPEALQSALADALMNVQRLTPGEFFSNPKPIVEADDLLKRKDDETPNRDSLTERFKNSAMNLSTYRRY